MTRSGWGLLGGGAILYAAAVAIGSPELAVLAVAALLTVLVAAAFLLRRPRLDIERRIEPSRVTVGQVAEGFVTVTNVGHQRSAAVECEDQVGAGAALVSVPSLAAGRAVTVPYALPTHRRCVLAVGPLELVIADPFGLMERRLRFGSVDSLYVQPRIHSLPAPQAGLQVDLDAETASTTRGDASFHALREYVWGDDLRRVHWKATAHVGNLMVREQVDPVRPDTTVVLDARTAVLAPDRFELAVEVLASIAVAALDRGLPVDVTGTAASLRITPAPRGRGAVLDRLAAVEQHDDGTDLAAALEHVVRTGSGRSLVLVTGRPSDADLARLAAGGRRFQEILVISVDDGTDDPDRAPLAAPGRVQVIEVASAAEFVAAWDWR